MPSPRCARPLSLLVAAGLALGGCARPAVDADDAPSSAVTSAHQQSHGAMASAAMAGHWSLSATQAGLHTPGTTWVHYGDVTLSGTAPAPGPVTLLRDGSVVGHATADGSGRFSVAVANPTAVTTVRYSARASGSTSPELQVANRLPSVSASVASTVDAVKPVAVALVALPGGTVAVDAGGAAAPAPVTAVPGRDGRATASLTGTGDLGPLTVRASLTAPDGTVVAAPPVATTRVARLDAVVRATTAADIAQTYRPGCPVGASGLRTITMNYLGFDHKVHTGGVMIVATDLADTVVAAFAEGLAAGFPIRQMANPNVWHGDDDAMMAADNTSGFNCRPVAGSRNWSRHALGRAVDVNTWENPYLASDGTVHGNPALAHARPAGVQGLLTPDGALTLAFTRRGATWLRGSDWQHFQW